eukprot:1400_1
MLSFLFLFVSNLPLTLSGNLPFTWNTVPVWSFPGFSADYITSNEINRYNLYKFNQVMICCVNLKCINSTNNSTYPPDLTYWKDHYYCGNEQNISVHEFLGNLESSLQYQAKQIKQNELFPNDTVVFGYLEWNNAQLSYASQQEFCYNSDKYSNYWLRLEPVGLINCMADETWCNYQGPSMYEYDFRQEIVRNYFVENIVLYLLNYDNYLDGVFIDSISLWMHLCEPNKWNCTQKEVNQLYNASLVTLDLVLNELTKMDKFVSISSHAYNSTTNSSQNKNYYNSTSFYWDMMNIMKKYPLVSIRYWEQYNFDDPQKFISFLWESQNNFKIQIHASSMTHNPDWVELASFLIAANNQSYFAYSTGWMINSGWWQAQFENKLGKPLNGYEYPGSNCTIVYDHKTNKYTTYYCHREFEFCIVDFDLLNKSATIKWSN